MAQSRVPEEPSAKRLLELERLVDELRRSVVVLSSEQSTLRRRFSVLEEASLKAVEQMTSLEGRTGALEREQEASSRLSRNAFESLSSRVTEHGVELAELPAGAEVFAVLHRLDSLEQGLGSLQEAVGFSCQRLESMLGDTRLMGLEAHEGLRVAQKDIEGCRHEVSELARQLFGTSKPDQLLGEGGVFDFRSATEPVTNASVCSAAGRHLGVREPSCMEPLAVEPVTPPLVTERRPSLLRTGGRVINLEKQVDDLRKQVASKADCDDMLLRLALKADCQDVQSWLAGKADVGHTHDRLISADGTSSFAL